MNFRRLFIASALAASAAVGTAAAVPASAPAVMTRTTGYNVDAALAGIVVTCVGTAPTATMNAHAVPNGVYHYATYVNSVLQHTGYSRANSAGVFIGKVPVANGKLSSVRMMLNGTSAIFGGVNPRCLLSAVSSASGAITTSLLAVRGSTTAYALHKNANGTITRWNPCDGNIHVRVNPTLGGVGALTDSINALNAINAATGLHFVYDGLTTFVPRSTNSASQPAALVIAWGTRLQTDYLSAGAIGEGGWKSTGTSLDGVHWTWKINKGFVVIDPAAKVTGGFGRGISRGSLLLHELGHVAGLGHSGESLQVMYPALSSTSYASLGSGDRAGLSAVGAKNGCVVAH